jgi:hypothetical protein
MVPRVQPYAKAYKSAEKSVSFVRYLEAKHYKLLFEIAGFIARSEFPLLENSPFRSLSSSDAD